MDSSLCVIEIITTGESGDHKVYVYDLFYTYGTKNRFILDMKIQIKYLQINYRLL